jgi:hypothetical protein
MTANLLISGPAQSGRSNVAEVLAAAASLQGSDVYGIRPDASDARFYRSASDLADAAQLLAELYAVVRGRAQLIKAHGLGTVEHLPLAVRPSRIFLIVDGLRRLPLTAAGKGAGAARIARYRALVASVDRLGRAGRHLRVHVIVVTDAVDFVPPWNTAAIRLSGTGVGVYDDEGGLAGVEHIQFWTAPASDDLMRALNVAAGARAANRSPLLDPNL